MGSEMCIRDSTYIGELDRYTKNVLSRCVFYHLANSDEQKLCEGKGLRVVTPGETFKL